MFEIQFVDNFRKDGRRTLKLNIKSNYIQFNIECNVTFVDFLTFEVSAHLGFRTNVGEPETEGAKT